MRKIIHLLSAAVFAACIIFSVSGVASARPGPEKNIILISWDGAQRNHLANMLKAGKLPNLAALRDEGKMIPIEVTNHQSDTKAGHMQMLTGYKPETTGVYSNARFDAIPAGLSLFDRIEAAFGDDAVTTLLLTGKSANIGSMTAAERAAAGKKNPESKEKKKKAGKKNRKGKKKKAANPNTPEPWRIIRPNIDVWDGDLQRAASVVGPLAEGYLEKYAALPFFFFLHFSDPDHAGHKFGENSKEYEQGIIACDTWLGALRKKIAELGLAGRTLIYVTTDHGFDEGARSHRNAPQVWLVTNDAALTAAAGDQMDIAPTILKREGIAPESVSPPLPGKALF